MVVDSSSSEKKLNLDKYNDGCQYPANSQLTEVNRTRKILLLTIASEFVLSIISAILVIYSYALGYSLGFDSYNIVLRFLPLLSCLCFGFGLIAVDRYHVKGLFLFGKLVMIDLILTYSSLTVFMIIPMCVNKYAIGIIPAMSVTMSYFMICCVIAVLPAYTIRCTYKLANLLTDSECLTFK